MRILACLAIVLPSLLLCRPTTFAQSSPMLDSLHRALSTVAPDTAKIKVLYKLCWEHMQNRGALDSSRHYALQGQELSKTLDFPQGIVQADYYLGLMDRLEGNYISGIPHFHSYINFHASRGDSARVANALYQLGVIYNYQGAYEKSLRAYFRILPIYEMEGDNFMKATILNSVGIIYKDMGNYDDAIAKFNEAYTIFNSQSSEVDIADCLHNLGNAYALKKDYSKALDYYRRSLQMDEDLGNEWGIAYQLESIGTVYMEMGQYNTALLNQIRSLEIRERLQQKKELASSLSRVGELYTKLGQEDKAIEYFNRSLKLADENGLKPGVLDAYRNLAEAFYGLQDYKKAYDYRVQFGALGDSLFHEDMSRQIIELQTRYEADKKEQQIVLLNQDKKLQQSELSRQKAVNTGLGAGLVLLALAIIAVWFNYREKLKSNQIIALKDQEINRQKIVELEKNQKLYALDAMITGQDVERKRIARDLHDGLGALLSTVQMHFTSIENEIKKLHEMDVYNKANQLLDEACQEVRKISHNMMPGTLMKYGLVPAIQDMCDTINGTGKLQMEFHAFNLDNERLEESVEITLYRLTQECTANIVNHAQAQKAIVQLSRDDESIHLTVEDDGVGFNLDEARKKKGMGLRNLESRVKYLNGKLDIHTETGAGTSISIEIPIN